MEPQERPASEGRALQEEPKQEGFLTPRTPFGMTCDCFFSEAEIRCNVWGDLRSEREVGEKRR
jgi:hypothetical protein